MEMVEVEITYEKLFEIISQEENTEFIDDEEYFQNTPLEIVDEYDQWVPIKGLIKKQSEVITFELDNDINLVCADRHQMFINGDFFFAQELFIGNNINEYIITNIEALKGLQTVYDVEVDSNSHVYKCALGITHHNTLLTSAIIKYANQLNMRTITIVPSSSLLKQTHDYIEQFDIPVGMFGAGKKDDAQNIVATWQTLQNNMLYVKDFQCIIWDECHTAKAWVAQQIMQNALQSFMRIGLTGTIPKPGLDKTNLLAAFGPVTYDVKAYELQERNILSQIHISVFELGYSKEFLKKLPATTSQGNFIDWHEETKFLQGNPMFQTFMVALLGTLENNTLILMKNKDPAEALAKVLGCTYIKSELSIDKRQEKFDEFVYGGNQISVGTYSLLSTGLDIVHINNLVLAPTSGKSFTKVIQSIGRGLRRKGGQKEHVNVVDLTSNLKYDKKHVRERKKYYKEARYPFEIDKMEMDQFDIGPSKSNTK